MTPIRTNKPVFFGNSGEVLKGGFVYIGEANKDPRSYPKPVTFKDSAGAELTAAQPLRTNSEGQIAYNGKAIVAMVDGDYSMLVLDANGAQVRDGYTPLVEVDADDPGQTGVVQYGLLLADIKGLPVTPGDTVENAGKVSAEDGLGAQWLVVSSTGGAADDVDLIDFDNGTQGKRLNNVLYSKDPVPVANGGTGAASAADARTNLDVYGKSEVYTKTEGDGRYLSSSDGSVLAGNLKRTRFVQKVAFAASESKAITISVGGISEYPLTVDRYINVYEPGTSTKKTAAYIANMSMIPGHNSATEEVAYIKNGADAVDVELNVTVVQGD